MIHTNQTICPLCGGILKYYDKVRRIVRTKRRNTYYIKLRRMRCEHCNSIHREINDLIFPYKQYESELITGVLEGIITCETLGFEDYPCEMTMKRWLINLRTNNNSYCERS